MKKNTSPCPFDGKVRRSIVSALVVDTKKCNWPIEMKMTKNLLKEHPDPDFWFFLGKSFKFQSLINLLSQKDIIFRQFIEYTKQKNFDIKTSPETKLADKKLGEDIIVKREKQTLLDFIS